MDVDEEEDIEYGVEEILDSRRNRGKVYYRVRWEGYAEQDDTWEPIDVLDGCPDKLREFREKFPNKPFDQVGQ